MEMKHAIVPFELKAAEDADSGMGMFEGYGSTFGDIDFGGDRIDGGAFRNSLDKWMAKGQLPQMLGFHKGSNVIGDWLVMKEDEKGLYVKGQLWVKGDARIEQAIVAHNILRGTGPKGLSIGYRVVESDMEEFDGGSVRRIKEVELFEVSVVGYAMNEQAFVTAVKSMTDDEGRILSKREVEEVLRDAGLSRKKAKAFIAGGYDSICPDDKKDNETNQSDSDLDLSGLLAQTKTILTNLQG